MRLHLPSLRDRADDIPLLVQHFLDTGSYNRRRTAQPRVRGVARDAMAALQTYPWPGNVRELVNVIERAVSFCSHEHDRAVRPARLRRAPRSRAPPKEQPRAPLPRQPTGGSRPSAALSPTPPPTPDELLGEGVTFKDAKERWVATFERDYILQMLRRNSGNISHAARAADIDRKYFRKLMKKYDIEAAGVDDDDDE